MRSSLLVAAVALTPLTALAQSTPYTSITSTGALTGVHLGPEGSVQVAHVTDGLTHEFYPPGTLPGDAGTLLVIDGVLYAPDFANHSGGSATGSIGTYTAFTPISQSLVLGAGTTAAPFRVETVVDAGTTGIRVLHVDRYVVGQESYRTDVTPTNLGSVPRSLILYRAADCFLGGSDSGFGVIDALSGAVGCAQNANNVPAGRIEQWLPLSPGSTFYQAGYNDVWSWIGTHQPFPDTCDCNVQIDNGAGLSWVITLPAGASVTRSHITTFSPLGTLPVTLAKDADTATTAVGGGNGYAVIIDNRNTFDVPITSVVDTLPVGFTYVPGSTSGAITADPVVAGRTLTWTTTTVVVPGLGASSFHFAVTVGTSTGTFYNNASATAPGSITVSPTGDTAPVTVFRVVVPVDAGPVIDASAVVDAGGAPVDAGGATDTGGVGSPDAGGFADAGLSEDGGGTPLDAAPAEDAALIEDAGDPGPADAAPVADDAAPVADDAAPVADDAAPVADDDAGGAKADAGPASGDAGSGGGRDASLERVDSGVVLGGEESCSCQGASPGSSLLTLFLVGLALAATRRAKLRP